MATKLGVDFYPNADIVIQLGYFLIMTERTEEGRAIAKRLLGDYERPPSISTCLCSKPWRRNGGSDFYRSGRRWLRNPQMHDAAVQFVSDGIVLHPKSAALHELLGDPLVPKGRTEQAADSFRMAYQLDSKLAKGATLEEYVAARMKIN